MPRLSLVVRGRVQGVNFRAATRRQARLLGLVGWVCNRPDGAVEVCAEGDAAALGELRAWAERGPPAARVDALESEWRDAKGGFLDFEIT